MDPHGRTHLPRLVPLPGAAPGRGRRRLRGSAKVAVAIGIAGAVVWAVGGAACGPGDEPLPPRTERPDAEVGDAGTGPCTEGATRTCTIVVGEHGDVVTCLEGLRTCRDGVWSECEGTMGYNPLLHADAGEDDPPDCPVPPWTTAISPSTPCENNPCDPSCRFFPEAPTGGIPLEPHIAGYYDEGTLEDAIAHSPQGFIDKGLHNPCSTTMDCQFDFHCVGEACQPWGPGETIAGCALPDLTTGFACTKDGQATIPVCNRGNATAPAGVVLYIFPGNSPQFPTCIPDNKPYICRTEEAIGPGACINVLGCPGLTGKGNKTVMVNPPENPPAGEPNPDYVPECTCENNWGDWSGSDTYCIQKPNYDTEPLVYTQTYRGECPAGSHVQWGYLTYETETPSDSSVVISGHTAEYLNQIDDAPLVDLAFAKAIPAPNTESCALSGPDPCPIDLYTKLGGPRNATNTFLELVFRLNPSGTKAEGPTLRSWEVTYSCPWTE